MEHARGETQTQMRQGVGPSGAGHATGCRIDERVRAVVCGRERGSPRTTVQPTGTALCTFIARIYRAGPKGVTSFGRERSSFAHSSLAAVVC
eukprot:4099065-Prymnesium_polylepis.2